MAKSKELPLPELPDRLHSIAIHLLRRIRVADDMAGLSAPRLSALSVLVFRGAMTAGELASVEQVRPPSMTRIVRELESAKLVSTSPNPNDRRGVVVRATRKGVSIVQEGRSRRVQLLQTLLGNLAERDRRTLARAVAILERVVSP